jgi:sugar phosphate isomerase/epimerase
MQLTRRHLLAASLVGAASALLGGLPRGFGAEPTPPATGPGARLRFSSWLNMVRGNLSEQLRWVEAQGFEAIELRGNFAQMHPAWKEALRSTPLVPSALDWSSMGTLVAGSAIEQQKALSSLQQAIDIAADLRVPNIIIVPPRLGQGLNLPEPARAVERMAEILGGLADRAAQAGTCLLIEPVSRKGVHCIHTIADGVDLCRRVNKPGVGVVGDFCHMIQMETDLTEGLAGGGAHLRQIHLSSRRRTLPGQEAEDREKFTAGFRGLKRLGYHGFCSFECGKLETYQDQVPGSLAFLRSCWAEA